MRSLAVSRVTDKGMQQLATLDKLEDLWIGTGDLTDAGFKELAKLKALKMVQFFDRPKNVSKSAVAEVQKALPNAFVAVPN